MVDPLLLYLDADGFTIPNLLREFETTNCNHYTLSSGIDAVTHPVITDRLHSQDD